jgi:hypothetical protein
MVDIQPQSTQPISDDQELAKVLAGISQTADDSNLQFDNPTIEQPVEGQPPIIESEPQFDIPAMPAPMAPISEPATTPLPTPNPPATPDVSAPVGGLGDIKKNAIDSLRPLLGKLQSSPEDTFDAYLLIIRSTDDSSLIGEAYAAAQNIADETRKAQALLEIVKEIDYLSNPK